MGAQDRILELLRRRPSSGAALARRLGISRQAVNASIKQLILAGRVVKSGSTRAAEYSLAPLRSGTISAVSLSKTYALAGLAEDAVFQDAARRLHLTRTVLRNVADIVQYGFTEMLNNAVEHSHSDKCRVALSLDNYAFSFTIRDTGIGLFHSIASKFRLPDENAAVGELLKGKTTTMAEHHSGEGIYFTCRAADNVSFRSHRIELVFYGGKQDAVVNERRFLAGTEVRFQVGRRSRRRLESIFEEYAPADLDYRFEKTRVFVKLFRGEYVSRSEARRMVAGLDRFRIVELDFRDVRRLGQGFADEVFRVFAAAHPGIEIRIANLSPALEPMLRHVLDNVQLEIVDDSLTILKAGEETSNG